MWYGDEKKIHFETQFIAGGRLEIGLHLESDPDTNERLATALEKKEAVIRRALGDEPRFGSHGSGWRSLFERWAAGDLRNEEAATEAAARLAEYVVAVAPMLSRPASARARTGSRSSAGESRAKLGEGCIDEHGARRVVGARRRSG